MFKRIPYEKIKVELETLSPAHIGSGERLTAFEYIQERNVLKVYPFDYFLSLLSQKPRLTDKNILLKMREETISLDKIFEEYHLKDKPKYELRIVGNLGRMQLETFIKNIEGPYIPGSEVKGAIRTAFIGSLLLEDSQTLNNVIDGLKRVLNDIEKLKDYNEEIEKLLRPKGQNAKYDLLKALQIPDIQVRYEDLYAVELKMVNSGRSLYPCEALKSGVKATFEMNFTYKLFETIKAIDQMPPHIERLKALKEKVNGFYLEVLEQEIEYFKRHGNGDVVKKLEEIKGKANEGMLLRIGKHQGFLSTTIMGIIRKKDKELFERVYERAVATVRQEKPKTRRITCKGEPMGWVLLKFNV